MSVCIDSFEKYKMYKNQLILYKLKKKCYLYIP